MSGKETIAKAVKKAQKQKGPQKKARPSAEGFSPENHDLPRGCPVQPLGLDGDLYYYLDANSQLRSLAASKHGRLDLQALFVPHSQFLEDKWPRWSAPDKDGNSHITGWKADEVSTSLMDACGRIGPISIENKVRWPGCWKADDGRLVMHCGDKVFCGDQAWMPGSHRGYVYPAAPNKPYPKDAAADIASGQELLSLLKTWEWRRPDIDPHLLLGWMAAAMLGGALNWRPLIWITGDAATGKSTLHYVIKHIMGEDGVISTADTTAAGIRQAVGHMTLPVAIDELEAEEDNRRQIDVIKLARAACSGAQALRGGADHKGSRFVLRSCFMFSSILIPPLMAQDISRMAILQLDALQGGTPPSLEPDYLNQIGAAFRRRLLDRWDQFQDILARYRQTLGKAGHNGRSADQFGTLLACHDLLLFDAPPDSDSLDEWAERLKWVGLSEAEDDEADWQRCMNHMMQMPAELYRSGERRSIGSWVMQAAGMDEENTDKREANRILGNYGLRVKFERVPGGPSLIVLLVANSHQGLQQLFRDTHWAGKSGTAGVWVQAMRRVPYAVAGKTPTRFDGVLTRYTQIPLNDLMKNDGENSQGGDHVFAS